MPTEMRKIPGTEKKADTETQGILDGMQIYWVVCDSNAGPTG